MDPITFIATIEIMKLIPNNLTKSKRERERKKTKNESVIKIKKWNLDNNN